MANPLRIILPYRTLLRCRLDTTVLLVESRDIRTIDEICEFRNQNGLESLIAHLPREKDRSWWDQVESVAANFSWQKFYDPVPQLKPCDGTLEFFNGGGCHRAMALAMHGDRIPNSDQIEVDLLCV